MVALMIHEGDCDEFTPEWSSSSDPNVHMYYVSRSGRLGDLFGLRRDTSSPGTALRDCQVAFQRL
jgi:hypothetical protein